MPRLKHLLSSPLQKKFSDPALECKLHHGRDFHLFCSLLYSWYLERRLVHSRYSILVHWIKYKVEIPWKVLLLSLKFQSLSGFWFFTQIPEIFIVRQISPFHIFTALKKKKKHSLPFTWKYNCLTLFSFSWELSSNIFPWYTHLADAKTKRICCQPGFEVKEKSQGYDQGF